MNKYTEEELNNLIAKMVDRGWEFDNDKGGQVVFHAMKKQKNDAKEFIFSGWTLVEKWLEDEEKHDKETITARTLRDLLKRGGKLSFTSDELVPLMADNPDLAWLYDTATEVGNSEAIRESYDEDGATFWRFTFHQSGCCELGLVFEVTFTCREDKLPDSLADKVSDPASSIFPEDVIKGKGGFIPVNNAAVFAEITYSEYYDENPDDDDEGLED